MTATLIATPQAGVVLKNISWQTWGGDKHS
jgi:hypothetical protein